MKTLHFFLSLPLIHALFFGSVNLAFAGAHEAQDSAPEPPNVLMICVDDLHPLVLKGALPLVQTPALDRLKNEGVYFVNAACNTPVCNPSRSSFFSGLYPHSTGAYLNGSDGWNRSVLLKHIRNIPEHFRDQGYKTWGAGKILHNPLSQVRESAMWSNAPTFKGGFGPFGDEDHQYGNRFRSIQPWDGPDSDFPDCVNAEGAIAFLKEHHEQPFLLYYGLWRPHSPYTAPKRFFDLYDEGDFDFPAGTVDGDLNDVPRLGQLLVGSLDRYQREGMSQEEVLRRFLYAYAANTSFMDWNVGRVLDALRNSPYADNTLVVFFSDNGFHTTEKDRWGKATLWDLSANVSLIVKAPDGQAAVSEATVSLVDLYPTLIEWCGVESPGHNLDGQSFAPWIHEPSKEWNRPSFLSYGINYSSVRDEDFRYIRYPDGSEELYRYADDPYELSNLADLDGFEDIKSRLKSFIPDQWEESKGGRLEIPRDFDEVMRERTSWFDLKPNS